MDRALHYLGAAARSERGIAAGTVYSAEALSCRGGRAEPIEPLIARFEVTGL